MSYCIYKFTLNEDMATITFQSVDGIGENVYPVLSLCFSDIGIYNGNELLKIINPKKWKNIKKEIEKFKKKYEEETTNTKGNQIDSENEGQENGTALLKARKNDIDEEIKKRQIGYGRGGAHLYRRFFIG